MPMEDELILVPDEDSDLEDIADLSDIADREEAERVARIIEDDLFPDRIPDEVNPDDAEDW